jgi:hypothetical protein
MGVRLSGGGVDCALPALAAGVSSALPLAEFTLPFIAPAARIQYVRAWQASDFMQ